MTELNQNYAPLFWHPRGGGRVEAFNIPTGQETTDVFAAQEIQVPEDYVTALERVILERQQAAVYIDEAHQLEGGEDA